MVFLDETLKQFSSYKGISEELLLKVVENMLLEAYRHEFGDASNAVTQINAEEGKVALFSKKNVVEKIRVPRYEIVVSEAKLLDERCELGDEIFIEVDPATLSRFAIRKAKQIAFKEIKKIEGELVYKHYRAKLNHLVSGSIRREKNGALFVDLGLAEAILPYSQRLPREVFNVRGRVRAVIHEVNERYGCQVVLSRVSSVYVRRLLEMEIPEIQDGLVEVKALVRDAGYKTKIAVHSERIDPVAACIGIRGARIYPVVRELDGEKIDVLRYSEDPVEYVKSALMPSKVDEIFILNDKNKEILAVMEKEQLSLAIGKRGQNIKLACALTGWNIDVKTNEDVKELRGGDRYQDVLKGVFNDSSVEESGDAEERFSGKHPVAMLSSLGVEIIQKLQEENISFVEDLMGLSEDDYKKFERLNSEEIGLIVRVVADTVEFVDDEEPLGAKSSEIPEVLEEVVGNVSDKTEVVDKDFVKDGNEDYEYYCPECDESVDFGQTKCLSCGEELIFS